MLELAKRFLRAIGSSKKAMALVGGVVFTLLSPLAQKIGWDLTEDQVIYVVTLIAAYLVGQGVADMGKPRLEAELKLAAVKGPSRVASSR